MMQWSRVAAFVMSLMSVLLMTAALRAEQPEKKAKAVKPQWQRMLQGDEARKVEEQDKKLIQLLEAGRFADALKVAQAVLELRIKVQGADHWEVANDRAGIEAISRVLHAHKETQDSYRRALALIRLASALEAKGRYREAFPLREQCLALFRKVLGDEHPYTAVRYGGLANNLQFQGKYKEAEQTWGKALSIDRKVLGEEHPNTAKSYGHAAASRDFQGKYREAEDGYRKAAAILRKVMGEQHLDTAIMYSNLAFNLKNQGKYKEAEQHHRKALAIFRKVLGEEHQNTAGAYNNLAVIVSDQDKFAEAEESYRKSLAIARKVLGEEHPNTALSYHNLAYNLDEQGKHQEAEEVFRRALAIFRKVLGDEHPLTAQSYDNLANSQDHQRKYQEAEAGHRKTLAIRRKVLGEEHPDTATTYNSLAVNQDAQGKYAEADAYYGKALAINQKVLGEDHRHTASCYANIAVNRSKQGKYVEAESHYRKALAIRQKILGEEHFSTIQNYHYLANNQHDRGKYEEAETFLIRAADSFAKARLHVAASGLERAAFSSEHSPLPALAAVLARNGKTTDAWQRFEESLARGTWDDLSARLRRPQNELDKQEQITARIDRLQKLIEKISVAKPTPQQRKQREEQLTQLRKAYDDLADFTQQVEKKYGPVAGQVIPRGQIQQSLPVDSALIGWLDIAGQPKAADPNGEHWAVLLRANGDPIWVKLHGSGDNNAWTDADSRLPARLREALQTPRGLWQPLAERLRKQRLDPLTEHLKGVRRLIVLPSTALAGVPLEVIADGYTISYAYSATMYAHLRQPPALIGKGLFVLADPVFDPPNIAEQPQPLPPSGVLLTVVAPGGNAAKAGLKPNDVLLRYGDTGLNAVADLKPQPDSKDPNNLVPVVVWRDGRKLSRPLFVAPGKLGVVIAKESAPQAVAEQRRINRLLASRSGDDDNWPRLPGTRIEAASLQRLFGKDIPTQILLDSDASEQRIDELSKRGELSKYRYVHLATHGEVDNVFPLRSAVILSRDHLPDDKQRTEFLLSGQPIPDGRLTAEDALRRWNLHADLVTLSACQTALGKYERGEGFVGFAQALILCGTRSVCLSLWKVDDVATALLMERFYQNLLGKRDGLKSAMPKAAALSEAKNWLRTLPREEAVKRAASLTAGVSRGKRAAKLTPLQVPAAATANPSDPPFAHPRYWAAFILIGHAD